MIIADLVERDAMRGLTITIQSKAHLSVSKGQLKVEPEGKPAKSIPLTDIWVLIIESHQVTVTTACLSALTDSGIGVMTCGRDHMPNGLLLPLGAHSRHAAIVEDQLAIKKGLRNQLWKRIVERKIANQASVLDEIGSDPKVVARLRGYAATVRSGDSDNREGAAAALYFRTLIKDGGRRDSAEGSALDYGYAVLRAGIGREGVGGGWLVSRGIHHHSAENAFNLIDDLIEPFRPIVDLMCVTYDLKDPLMPEDKRCLSTVFSHKMRMRGRLSPVDSCIAETFESLRQAVKGTNAGLLALPELCGLEVAKCE